MLAAAARQLIERRYASVHGAVVVANYPHFCTVPDSSSHSARATLGFRFAAVEPLFLEAYLDEPIEEILSEIIGEAVTRDRIVELGAHASKRGRAIMRLWAHTARHLHGRVDIGVAVLTAPLRSMFARLAIPIHEICDADPQRLPDQGRSGGRYYELRPRVCAGLIAEALAKVGAFDDDQPGACACRPPWAVFIHRAEAAVDSRPSVA